MNFISIKDQLGFKYKNMNDKIIVQIIGKDQAEYIPKMIEATKGFDRIWGLDRCIDNSVSVLQTYGERFVENHEGEGFLAGKMRDRVIDEILLHDYDYVVMFDGDRIPFNLTKELVLAEMAKYDCTYALAEKDLRRERECIRYDISATAGLIVKTSFLRKIRQMKFMHNRCFHPDLDGYCGFEDVFFGACLYGLGATLKIGSLAIAGEIPSGATYENEADAQMFIRLLGNIGVPLTMLLKIRE